MALTLNIKKAKLMASSPITSWQREGEKVEAVTGFIFLGSKITADGDCSHEIKRCLMFGRETMINIDTVLKEENEKASLKGNIQKTKNMASSPITPWQIDGGKIEAVTGFIFLGSKITSDSNCSHEIKRHLFLRRKVMTNLDSILKSINITFPIKSKLWFFQ